MSFKKLSAFTLAEILLSLSIIGIVAAIALPSLLGNVNERAFETQKKALYTRFSQALPLLPSLNGYGTLEGTYSTNSEDGKQHVDVDTATETFIRDGLSKVMKVTNICDSEHLTDCGLPDKIIAINGSSTYKLKNINTLSKFNEFLVKSKDSNMNAYEILDTKAGAFETVNGESVLVYYNPNCEPDLGELTYGVNVGYDTVKAYYIQPKMCANFIYDLNGKKGPNTVGKDIGAITVLYSIDPIVVSPNPYPTDSSESIASTEIDAKCKELGPDAKAPTIDEVSFMYFNIRLFGLANDPYWSNTVFSPLKRKWVQNTGAGARWLSTGSRRLRCVKR